MIKYQDYCQLIFMIFRDLIQPDKFKIGMTCRLVHHTVLDDEFITILEIIHDHKYYAIFADDDTSWSRYGTYLSHHYIKTSCEKFRCETMKSIICNKLYRIIPV